MERAIFLQGIQPRSGTNFLHELLIRHPDCASTGLLQENYLLMFSHLLGEYVDSVQTRWSRDWGLDDGAPDSLFESIGDGLIQYLRKLSDGDPRNQGRSRLVCRTPQVRGLEHFPKLFPRARLILLIRDGRDLVESFVRSFQAEYREVIERWTRAAELIVRFDETHRGRFPYVIVKYERLCTHLEEELRRIFAAVELDPARYDFAAAADTPVIGSSVFRGGESAVHWKPVPKTSEFNPLERARDWTPAMHAEFEAVAGAALDALGYRSKTESK